MTDDKSIHEKAIAAGYNLRRMTGCRIGVSLDECATKEDVVALLDVFGVKPKPDLFAIGAKAPLRLPEELRRTSGYLSHPVFRKYQSEAEMVRYLRKLQQKDIALDRSMIPLGSCTMKLNATTEMIPITWSEFSDVHPFVPLDQVKGFMTLAEGLQDMLCRITGFDAFSLQPNAGSQGEYAGLLCIRTYHQSLGQEHRNVCLISR